MRGRPLPTGSLARTQLVQVSQIFYCERGAGLHGPYTRRGLDPRVRELVMLSALAALGCGLAAVQGDLLFVAIFGAACAVTIIEAIRRLQ